jgi:hypothetical protein
MELAFVIIFEKISSYNIFLEVLSAFRSFWDVYVSLGRYRLKPRSFSVFMCVLDANNTFSVPPSFPLLCHQHTGERGALLTRHASAVMSWRLKKSSLFSYFTDICLLKETASVV